jgi:hypothetical protein
MRKKIFIAALIIVLIFVAVYALEAIFYLSTGDTQYYLGKMYADFGNDQGALKWYTRAAEMGRVDSQYDLGYRYAYGAGVPTDYNEAIKWLLKAANQGDNLAQEWLEADARGITWLTKIAEQGYAGTQWKLGYIYYSGDLGVTRDYDEAFKWVKKAAKRRYSGTAYDHKWWQLKFLNDFGIMYYKGDDVSKDMNKAEECFEMGAELGDKTAQYNLGLICYNGEYPWLDGFIKDYKEALKWFTKAAEQGDADAQFYLGVMYQKGQGVIEDYVEAYKWYLLASMNGKDDPGVKNSLRELMTTEQTAEAQNRAKAFLEKMEARKK